MTREACQHSHDDDEARVTLVLLLPRGRAKTLVEEIDFYKRNGEVGAVSVNAMYVAAVLTTGPQPEGATEDSGWFDADRRVWWPLQLAYLLTFTITGAAVGSLGQPAVIVAASLMWTLVGLRITLDRGWRRHRKPKRAAAVEST